MKKARLYCNHCGQPVNRIEYQGKLRDYCQNCATIFYENPLPVVSTIVVNDAREVLLVKRKHEPYSGMWCLPIGFAESGENMDEAALRELKEETGIQGRIMRLIDVDTIDNYFYGSLAIVTYEVKRVGGKLRPGDDAVDALYFPIKKLPPLAWSSNDKAIRLYLQTYKDTWAMVDSFKQLFPEDESGLTINIRAKGQQKFLSDLLIKILEKDSEAITGRWTENVKRRVPELNSYLKILAPLHTGILNTARAVLRGDASQIESAEFISMGRKLKSCSVPLPAVLTALALSRRSIWIHVVSKKILASPLEIYATLELNNRIIFLYDRINTYLCSGYLG